MDATERLDPVGFARIGLRQDLYPWQASVLFDLFFKKRVALRACNGSGKTSKCVAPAALWLVHEWAGSTVVITSATDLQLRMQVAPALQKMLETRAGPEFYEIKQREIEFSNGSRIILRSTDSGGKFEGFHGSPDAPLLVIVDEAKTVNDDIFTAIDRCQPDYLLVVSSPGGRLGRFYELCQPESGYAIHAVGVDQCPHINPAYVEEMAERYGRDSEIFRSMMLGEFGSENNDLSVIPLRVYLSASKRDVVKHNNKRRLFCDFAEGGGDENVLAVCDNGIARVYDAWVQSDGNKDSVVARFMNCFRELGAKDGEIYGDAGGMGFGYIYALRQNGFQIIGIRNGEKSNHPERYFNLAAEQWFTAAGALERGEVALVDNQLLKQQLCSRVRKPREDGLLQLLPKKESGQDSPDRADAIVGAIWATGLNRVTALPTRPAHDAQKWNQLFSSSNNEGALSDKVNV
jgi:hypothetical protein